MTRASENTLDSLHGLAAEALIEEISAYRRGEVKDKDGNTIRCPPALIAQALKMLAENGIDTPARAGNRVDRLKGLIPDMDELEKSGNIVPIRK